MSSVEMSRNVPVDLVAFHNHNNVVKKYQIALGTAIDRTAQAAQTALEGLAITLEATPSTDREVLEEPTSAIEVLAETFAAILAGLSVVATIPEDLESLEALATAIVAAQRALKTLTVALEEVPAYLGCIVEAILRTLVTLAVALEDPATVLEALTSALEATQTDIAADLETLEVAPEELAKAK